MSDARRAAISSSAHASPSRAAGLVSIHCPCATQRRRNASRSMASCIHELMDVPSADAQDRLLAEVRRVLRPGGLFVGVDSIDHPDWRELHSRQEMSVESQASGSFLLGSSSRIRVHRALPSACM